MPNNALYIGSFDPFTEGHMNVYAQASTLFDKVYVCIAANPGKCRRFTLESSMKAAAFAIGEPVCSSYGLATDILESLDCQYLIRGLRNTSDYLYEEQLCWAYKQLKPDVKMVYLKGDNFVSSSFVWELYKNHKDISKYVPYAPEMLQVPVRLDA